MCIFKSIFQILSYIFGQLKPRLIITKNINVLKSKSLQTKDFEKKNVFSIFIIINFHLGTFFSVIGDKTHLKQINKYLLAHG